MSVRRATLRSPGWCSTSSCGCSRPTARPASSRRWSCRRCWRVLVWLGLAAQPLPRARPAPSALSTTARTSARREGARATTRWCCAPTESGESDRVVVLWTRTTARCACSPRASARATSRLGGALEILRATCDVDLVATRGEFYIARHVEHLRAPLTTLRASYDRINAGYAVVEVVDAIPADDLADEGIFELLVRVLDALDDPVVRPARSCRRRSSSGSWPSTARTPVVDECVNCGRAGPLVAFDAQVGGTLCARVPLGPRAVGRGRWPSSAASSAATWRPCCARTDAPGAGEVAAHRPDSIEEHFGRRLRVKRAAPPLATRRPGKVPASPRGTVSPRRRSSGPGTCAWRTRGPRARRGRLVSPSASTCTCPFCAHRCDYCAFATYADRDHLMRRLRRGRARRDRRARARRAAGRDVGLLRRRHALAPARPSSCSRSSTRSRARRRRRGDRRVQPRGRQRSSDCARTAPGA